MVEPRDGLVGLFLAVYPELRAIAARLLRKERANHTLQRTALVNEAFVKLLGSRLKELPPERLLAFAAHQMRQVLVDYGRRHGASKRWGSLSRLPLFEGTSNSNHDLDSFLALNEALERLGQMDERALAVVELKFFGGHTNAETARILSISDGTVEADWQHARLWLFRELNAPASNRKRAGLQACLSESFQQA